MITATLNKFIRYFHILLNQAYIQPEYYEWRNVLAKLRKKEIALGMEEVLVIDDCGWRRCICLFGDLMASSSVFCTRFFSAVIG